MAFERIAQKDWYKILGAKPSDSLTELKRKYQKLVLLYHPDKQSADVSAGEVEERVQRFIEIDQAWKILGNEETKKEYDLQQRGNVFQEVQLYTRFYRLSSRHIEVSTPNNAALVTIPVLNNLFLLQEKKNQQVLKSEVVDDDDQMMMFGDKGGNSPLSDQNKEHNLMKEWPLHAQVYLEDMSWNEGEQCYTLSCRCGGNYTVSKTEKKDVSLVCCDTCSLVIEILQ